jgi:hypothetical protein
MPRPTKSPQERAADVQRAVNDLPALVRTAQQSGTLYGMDHPHTRRAWENVENAGATVHRQARLLAGKARGG